MFHTVAHSSSAATPAPLNPNKVFAVAHSFFKRGQPPLIVVLACGSLGLIGLSRFLQCSVPFFSPPFSAVFAVFVTVAPQAPLLPLTPQNIFYSKQEPPRLNHSISQATFHSFGVSALALSAKKTPLHGKNRASPAASGRQPQPSFRYAALWAICGCHPRSTRRRLAPLHSASKKITPLSLRKFFTCSVPAQGCFTCVVFDHAHTSPRPPTP